MASLLRPFRFQPRQVSDYYDIMVLGRNGMGKSTTASKLLIADVDGQNDYYQSSDFSVWLVSGDGTVDDNMMVHVKDRLKNIAFSSGIVNPHLEVNRFHAETSRNYGTIDYEVISNESNKLRILDTPGFNHADSAACMKKILQIQAAMHMNFRRILYFLPVRGALKEPDYILEAELAVMANSGFGRSIFDCMVVIATDLYEIFSDCAMATTQKYFDIVLSNVLSKEKDLPKPPIVFISMRDSCEEIYMNIDKAPVACNHIQLELELMVCVYCGTKVTSVGAGKEKFSCTNYSNANPLHCIPYEDSVCHPVMVPKYSILVKAIRRFAHFVTNRDNYNHQNDHDICIHCGYVQGSPGCLRVKTKYVLKNKEVLVDHHFTSIVDPPKAIGVNKDDKHKLPTNVCNSLYLKDMEERAYLSFLDLVECDFNGLHYSLEDYDISLTIPERSVAMGEVIHIELGVATYGPFNFPRNTRLISPVLWLRVLEEDVELRKPFQATLPHILSKLTNVKAQRYQVSFSKACFSSTDSHQTTFDIQVLNSSSDGAVVCSFTDSHGIVKMNKFCILCMTARNERELELDIGYCLTRVMCISQLRHEAFFCVSYNLSACLQVHIYIYSIYHNGI